MGESQGFVGGTYHERLASEDGLYRTSIYEGADRIRGRWGEGREEGEEGLGGGRGEKREGGREKREILRAALQEGRQGGGRGENPPPVHPLIHMY